MELIDDVKGEALRLWSMRAAIFGGVFWSAVGGALLIWPALAEHIPLKFYIIGGIVLSIAFGVARMLKQPGTEQ